MEIKFAGAARMVTGSSHLLTLDNGYTILMDCGLIQGKGKDTWDYNKVWHIDPKSIDCMVLSHAHIDHSGRIPQLVKDGFKGLIHSTHATRSLCSIMLLDSAKIQERDVEWHNKKLKKKRKKKSQDFRKPLYTSEDVPEAMDKFIGHSYNQWFHITDGVEALFRDQGHILGSASITLRIKKGKKKTTFGFTGDIGRPERPILRDPVQMPKVDYLICESTYGDKEHENTPEQSQTFLEIVKEACCVKKGKLIIPAFSIGRTQEIVYMLDKMETAGLLPKIDVFVDSPLAVNATSIYGTHPECYDDNLHEYMLRDDDPFGFNSLTYVSSVDESKALNTREKPAIIISSSGMMNAGRVKHHLFNSIEDPKNTFLIVGYCSPDTPGGMLKTGITEIKLFGEVKQVRATIKMMDSFSAHADRKEMVKFISNQKKVKQIYLTHGEYDTQLEFKKYLGENGFNKVIIPDLGEEYDLKTGKLVIPTPPKKKKKSKATKSYPAKTKNRIKNLKKKEEQKIKAKKSSAKQKTAKKASSTTKASKSSKKKSKSASPAKSENFKKFSRKKKRRTMDSSNHWKK